MIQQQLSEDIIYHKTCIQSKPTCKHILTVNGNERTFTIQELYIYFTIKKLTIPLHIKEEYENYIQRLNSLKF